MLAPSVPQSFLDGLRRDFGTKIRLRWSPARNRWQIERKGREMSKISDPKDRFDTWTRVREGFYRILETSPGSLVECSYCGADYHWPMFTLQAAKCPQCAKEELVMNWPLGDKLLEHLRFTDPERDGIQRLERDMAEAELRAELAAERSRSEFGKDLWRDEFTRIFEIQSRGYEGPAKAWENAPVSKRFGGNS